MSAATTLGLVADLGGTNARFATAAITPDGAVSLTHIREARARSFATARHAVEDYLAAGSGQSLAFAAIACAGPVVAGKVALTNLAWSLCEIEIGDAFDIGRTLLLNDLAAVAWAAPNLGEADLRRIGRAARPDRPRTIAVLGAGTGTNCSAFVSGGSGEAMVLVGEAGHAAFAPSDRREIELWRVLERRFGHVSIEHVASGPGLLHLYRALCQIDGCVPRCARPEEVSALAEAGDPTADDALTRLAMILGSVAGDFALTFGADAVYLAGGLPPALLAGDRAADFRRRFEAKGRFSAHLERVETSVILHPHAALLGATRAAIAQARAA